MRFYAWLIEKVVELGLASLLLLTIPVLTVHGEPYISGVANNISFALENLPYEVNAMAQGSYVLYFLKIYGAGVMAVFLIFYVFNLYIIATAVARGICRGKDYPRAGIVAFLISFTLFAFTFGQVWRLQNWPFLLGLLLPGLVIVWLTAHLGAFLTRQWQGVAQAEVE